MPAGIFKMMNGLLLFSAKPCPTLCDCKDCSTPGFPVLKYLPEFASIQVYWVGDAIQPSHYLLSPFPLAFNLSQHQCLFQWVGSSILYFNPLIKPYIITILQVNVYAELSTYLSFSFLIHFLFIFNLPFESFFFLFKDILKILFY